MKAKEIFKRYIFSTLGMLLVALGIAVSIVANLGTSPLNVASYAMSEGLEGITVGTCNFIVYAIFVLLQFVVLGKDFKIADLLQLVANILLSLMIDGSLWLLHACGIIPGSLAMQFVFIAIACVITAFGISMEVAAKAWMLPAEMTVSAFTRRFGGKFDTNKVIMDCLMLLLGVLLCLWFFNGRPLGPEGKPIIGWGTLIMAVCIGFMMKGSSPLVDKLWKRIIR
ncbi:MAG: YitT family protein [Candidatus Cryptobacteroides sp.]